MKKLLITISFLFILTGLQAQKPFIVFGNVPSDLFTATLTVDRTVRQTGDFLWSLDAVVEGLELNLNTGETTFLQGVGAAIGKKFYKPLPDGTIISKWGISAALLTKVKINDIVDTRMKIAVLANLYNITAGPVWTFKDNKLGLLIGANINF